MDDFDDYLDDIYPEDFDDLTEDEELDDLMEDEELEEDLEEDIEGMADYYWPEDWDEKMLKHSDPRQIRDIRKEHRLLSMPSPSEAVIGYLLMGKRLLAIKTYQKETGCRNSDAQEYIHDIEKRISSEAKCPE